MDYSIREIERENNSVIDYLDQQVDEMNQERDIAIKRSTESKIILASVMREKYQTHFLKRACFQAWKHFYDWKKYTSARERLSQNYYRKKSLQRLVNGWRKITHQQFLDKAIKERDEYELQQRNKVKGVDHKIDNLMLYLSQLQQKIEEETGLILEIPEEYQISVDTGISRIVNETDTLRNTNLFNEVKSNQQEIIYQQEIVY
eukprot:scpid97153/ scgid7810/ 